MEPLEKLDEDFDLDSDQDCDLRPIDSDDSDDEFSPDLIQRLRRFGTQLPPKKRKREKKEAEDDFEREVNAELAVSLAAHCRRIAGGASGALPPAPPPPLAAPPSGTGAAAAPAGAGEEQLYYDDVYFDSDDDSAPEDGPAAADSVAPAGAPADSATPASAGSAALAAGAAASTEAAGGSGGTPVADPNSRRSERRRRRRPVLTNDQLLYDPAMDDEDQQWVDRQRQRYLPARPSGSGDLQAKPQKLPRSDAVLNCPACMTMLCLDCQRHELYNNQYRAMFVFNCAVDESEALRYRLKEPPRRRGRRGAQPAPAADGEAQQLYNPVRCVTCRTEVAVYDTDEVYHFFNVIASHA
ncbi:E2F-associated phosphoprotein-like [Pollicipes pollicipes]|uniref:E2F-associated phosphoprotein-like n=1 Tax=Pollicipes pollicipes TaxID=41117 RepID=UPI001884A804|nr:E2F-associated phosphoprotein-like [Pollicipes pollicipes]XP_037072012.1 E2F-associated phosphoprotein-like [Pollicipes pollicipes]